MNTMYKTKHKCVFLATLNKIMGHTKTKVKTIQKNIVNIKRDCTSHLLWIIYLIHIIHYNMQTLNAHHKYDTEYNEMYEYNKQRQTELCISQLLWNYIMGGNLKTITKRIIITIQKYRNQWFFGKNKMNKTKH